jgi:hypothetical protein
VSRLGDLVDRWRAGRRSLEEAQADRDRRLDVPDEPNLDDLDGREIRIEADTYELAEELCDVLRKHGLACEIRRPKGSEVEVVIPDDVEPGAAMRSVVDALGLWLHLDHTPDTVEARCGKRTIAVDRRDGAAATPPV